MAYHRFDPRGYARRRWQRTDPADRPWWIALLLLGLGFTLAQLALGFLPPLPSLELPLVGSVAGPTLLLALRAVLLTPLGLFLLARASLRPALAEWRSAPGRPVVRLVRALALRTPLGRLVLSLEMVSLVLLSSWVGAGAALAVWAGSTVALNQLLLLAHLEEPEPDLATLGFRAFLNRLMGPAMIGVGVLARDLIHEQAENGRVERHEQAEDRRNRENQQAEDRRNRENQQAEDRRNRENQQAEDLRAEKQRAWESAERQRDRDAETARQRSAPPTDSGDRP